MLLIRYTKVQLANLMVNFVAKVDQPDVTTATAFNTETATETATFESTTFFESTANEEASETICDVLEENGAALNRLNSYTRILYAKVKRGCTVYPKVCAGKK